MKKLVLAVATALTLGGAANAGTIELCNPEAWYAVWVQPKKHTDADDYAYNNSTYDSIPAQQCRVYNSDLYEKVTWIVNLPGLGNDEVKVPQGDLYQLIRFHGTAFWAWKTVHGDTILNYEYN